MPLAKSGSAPVVEKPAAQGVITTSTTPPADAPKTKIAAKKDYDTTMSKSDWANKDKRISRQGLFQAALQSTGLLQLNTENTLDAYLKIIEQVAERGLAWVNKE